MTRPNLLSRAWRFFASGTSPFASRAEAAVTMIPAYITEISVTARGRHVLRFARSSTVPSWTAALVTANDVRWVPAGPVSFLHFGDGDDMRAAIQRCVYYMKWMRGEEPLPSAAGADYLTGLGETLRMSGPVWVSGANSLRFVGATFEAIPNSDGGVWSETISVVNANDVMTPQPGMFIGNNDGGTVCRNVIFDGVGFEGRHIVPGFVWFTTSYTCGVVNCRGHAPRDYGLVTTGTNGDLRAENNNFREWDRGETGWDDFDNWTADLIRVQTNDAHVVGNTLSNARCPLIVYSGAAQVSRNHPWQTLTGNGITIANLPVNLICAKFDLGFGSVTENYFDCGNVQWRCRRSTEPGVFRAVSFSNNSFLKLAGTSDNITEWVTLIARAANETLAGYAFIGNTFLDATEDIPTEFDYDTSQGGTSFVDVWNRVWHVAGNVRATGNKKARGIPDAQFGAGFAVFDASIMNRRETNDTRIFVRVNADGDGWTFNADPPA